MEANPHRDDGVTTQWSQPADPASDRTRNVVGPAIDTALCLVLALAILALDAITPLGIADGILYVAVLLLCPSVRQPRLIWLLAAGCSLLVAVGYWISPTVGVWSFIPVTNRILSVGMIWTTALLMHQLRDARRRIERQQETLRKTNTILERLARLDGLTGICNRRCFDSQLLQEIRRCVRETQPLSLLMIDIDHFKDFNDQAGHPAGDRCLVQVACTIRSCLHRPGDFLARYGGEEFAAILSAADADGAVRVAEEMRAVVEALRILHPKSSAGPWVTVSVGVGTIRPAAGSSDITALTQALLRASDAALYQAKQGGRNRVCVSESSAG
ncbi:MAG TPA: diguanylate cyclase [Acidobacteriota bacterium]|nr:diguanylate cyclase [Acidobacteriota bacterium]HQM63982.1 diguanylate cyclase [Acidobacteriota bacterium]